MIKQLNSSDITVRPFQTYKNWEFQSVDASETNSFDEYTYYTTAMTIVEGVSCSGDFYTTDSPYYDPILEPVNPNGEYKRIVYSVTDALYYRYDNPLQQFGREHWDVDPITGRKEVRTIHDRVLVNRIGRSYWGEMIRPGSVRIVDNSNLHEEYIIVDDADTNLIISGTQFPYARYLRPNRNLESRSYWDTSSGQFYYNETTISYDDANYLKNHGIEVTYIPDTGSWKYDLSAAREYYQPDNERFGWSVSAWYKYIVAGSPMDGMSFAQDKVGSAQLFKYDTDIYNHRFVNKFYSPFTQNGFAREFGTDNSLLIAMEDNNFPFIDINGSCATSSIQDEFGYSVSIKDDTLAIGAPNGDHCVSCDPHSGFVYVYDKYKGGADNWGLVSILEGSGSNARFGESVSVDYDLLAVGSPGTDGNRGSVYLFRRKTFQSGSCESVPTSSFWNYVTSQHSLCERIISETGNEVYGENSAPYFIVGDYTWTLEAVLTSSVSDVNDFFGSTLEVAGDRLVVGCRKLDGKGYVSVFTASFISASVDACPTASWGEYKIFRANDDPADLDPLSPFNTIETSLPYDGFGRKVAMDGDHIVVCSYYDKSFIPFVGSTEIRSLGAAYFFSFSNIVCATTSSVYDCSLRYKTFGDRSVVINNNFARDCSVRGTRAVVSAQPDVIWYSSSIVLPSGSEYSSFAFERDDYESVNATDPFGTLGSISMFNFDPETLEWDRFKTIKRSKETDKPNYSFGWSTCLSDFISGSKFLVAGSPVFNYTSDSEYDFYTSSVNLMNGKFPVKYSGSLYVYDLDTMETNPQIGNVFYKTGQIVLTNTSSNYIDIMTYTGSHGFRINYQGVHTIFEHEYLISINPGEFNYSTNPTSLVNYPVLFDVNQDGVFDLSDVDLILRYLNKQKFYLTQDTDDSGITLERDTLLDESWWNNDIMMTEAGDVILGEFATSSMDHPTLLNDVINEYIQTRIIDTNILDIDGNGQIDLRDGYLLLNYVINQLTVDVIEKYTDGYSTRKYFSEFKKYIGMYTGELNGYLVDPHFGSYLESSSFDPTGSYLSPYITNVGLYDNNQLVAVAKLGRPMKNLIDWPMNIIVRFDT